MELMGQQVESRFSDFGPPLLKRLLSTAKGMHYQAAERALLLLNGETIQKMVKANMQKAFPIMVHGLHNKEGKNHWNQTVNTITYSVIRTYMDIDMDRFERLTQQASTDQKSKASRQKEIEARGEALAKRHNIEAEPPIFPLNLWECRPEGFEETGVFK